MLALALFLFAGLAAASAEAPYIGSGADDILVVNASAVVSNRLSLLCDCIPFLFRH